jgi:hypothetical protein
MIICFTFSSSTLKVDYFFLAGNQHRYGWLDAAKPDAGGFLDDDVLELLLAVSLPVFSAASSLLKASSTLSAPEAMPQLPRCTFTWVVYPMPGLFRFRRLINSIQFSYRFQLFYHCFHLVV